MHKQTQQQAAVLRLRNLAKQPDQQACYALLRCAIQRSSSISRWHRSTRVKTLRHTLFLCPDTLIAYVHLPGVPSS